MQIIKMKDVEGFVNGRGVRAKELLRVDDVKIMNLELKAGDNVPAHDVPVHVFFYVVSGKGTIQIGEEKQVVEATDIIPCPAGQTMALWADQGEPFAVLNVKTPSY